MRPPEDPIALVHCRRDIALRKDVGPVRTGNAPQALAALWNTVLAGRPSPVGASLAAIREAFAENRLQTVATARIRRSPDDPGQGRGLHGESG